MDISDTTFKEDFNNIILNLKRLLPKKKDIIIFDHDKSRVRHLSNIHAEAKSVFPKCFHGAKLVIQSELLEKVKLVQDYSLGETNKTHKAVIQLLQKEIAPKHVDDGLLLDTSRSAVATYTEKIKNGEVKLTSRIRNLTSSDTEVVVERRNDKYMSSTAFSIKDANPMNLGILSQYMYRVKPDLCVGGEFGFKPFIYQSTPRFSISCRYDMPSVAMSCTLSRIGLQVCVFKEFSKGLRVASIATETVRGTVLSLAVHKGTVDSDLKVFIDSMCCAGVTYERNLLFQEDVTRLIRAKVSALIDREGKVRCGLGFDLDF